jgi:class 3 adenylate cyclase
MEREVRYCTTGDGVRIAYATTGSGYPLVRGLGWMSHLEFEGRTPLWRATNDALSAHFQFTRYDGRGTGLSDRNIEEFSLETYIADIEAVVDAAGLERFALLGISQGGAASIGYCLRHPERVSHLVLYGAYARPIFELEIVESLTALVRLGWETPAVRQLFTTAFIPDGGPEEMRWFNEFQRETASAAVAARIIQANRLDVSEAARSLSTPTLVIHRRNDGVVPFDQGRELASLIPGARFLPLDGNNHLFLQGEEELSNFVAAIDEFIGEDSAAAKRPGPAAAMPSSFRTVLFTDLVGHAEMMSRLGDERGRAVLREHERITREVLKAHGGTEVKTMGDGFMASFGSVTRAVECAIALQRAFAEREGEPLSVRVGLNAGEPIEEDGDLFGATVILASRIAAKAEGGEILVADTVRGLCSGKGFLFADRGEFVAKGFEEPVRVYEVRWRDGRA